MYIQIISANTLDIFENLFPQRKVDSFITENAWMEADKSVVKLQQYVPENTKQGQFSVPICAFFKQFQHKKSLLWYRFFTDGVKGESRWGENAGFRINALNCLLQFDVVSGLGSGIGKGFADACMRMIARW